MRFRNLTTDDRGIAGVGFVAAGAEFDLPDGFNVAGIAHQDIYEPADDEAKSAVEALLAQIAADAAAELVDEDGQIVALPDGGLTTQATASPIAPVVDPKADGAHNPAPTDQPADPATDTTEQENN